jgi:cytochrome c oxidase cbb3-type subunit I/II
LKKPIDVRQTPKKISAMQQLGVPYPVGYANQAVNDLEKQALEIVADLEKEEMIQQILEVEGVSDLTHSQMVALIAYLQRIGTDIKALPVNLHPEH